jgi:hypothetical protein
MSMPSDVLAARLMLVSCLAYSSTLKMEVTSSFETSVDFQRTAWRYILITMAVRT